jgi:hypothetical protein
VGVIILCVDNSTPGRRAKNTKCYPENLEGRDRLKKLGVGELVILKRLLRYKDVMV